MSCCEEGTCGLSYAQRLALMSLAVEFDRGVQEAQYTLRFSCKCQIPTFAIRDVMFESHSNAQEGNTHFLWLLCSPVLRTGPFQVRRSDGRGM
jgi:hypothetical protein